MTNRFRCAPFVIAALLACLPSLASGQNVQQRRAVDPEKKFVIFIHSGPLAPTHEVVRAVAIELAKAGYLVRAPDGDIDIVGGPGVDYFDNAAQGKAEEIARMVNAQLEKSPLRIPENRKLKARRQSVKNPSEYFGVWLFDKDVQVRSAPPAPAAGGPSAGTPAGGGSPTDAPAASGSSSGGSPR